ncbi:phosphogluconate dehydrogenase (NADP(+)-dependent, decarboxylating) [Aerococcus urinaehominis]|uniref:6-phosphogluconate dehydrogenase, decarboxylating n=1 Tax=Aerococcus urinaehominis TaxID=128944 RepID=A0A109RGY2_9LACT|nr:NADP-dependent phosphogluconate dehydrogenase [Aerococcus urinaehominis]AMB99683.1 phosphogluconate dehydrogenase (NADP(+)-dependent, decarboxylating) [Aerococcus urinaehominis]SDL90314.1 6-phosphogluconate dehydrogenase [Aerococcus urinaehominis]
MSKAQIGVVGMAVMGKNLALNIESRGYQVAVFNRTTSKTEEVVAENPDKNLLAATSLEDFVASLETPRRIVLMVKAGPATDATIKSLLPLLDEGDVLIDGGNTFFKDTMRRSEELAESGIHFIGMGVSGGEEGALKGPSLMPGGQKEAYDLVAPILEKIAAKAPQDQAPCVTYIGPNGAGHFVKMVHNGIEYGDMQLIAESYDLLRRYLDLSVAEIADYFKEWNQGELDSYLIEITADILTKKDPDTGKPMVDVILDRAGNKGTGKWTSQSSLDLGVPLQTITESVYARYISALKEERVIASKQLNGPEALAFEGDKADFVEDVRQALFFSKIMSYAQGFAQYREASETYDWDLNYQEIAKIFRAGCIIRAQFLDDIAAAYDKDGQLQNILLDDYFQAIAEKYQAATRRVAAAAIQAGIPVPGFTSALSYYDSYRTETLPANIIQAQRDYFGAHTYERTDRPGSYHFLWDQEKEIDA